MKKIALALIVVIFCISSKAQFNSEKDPFLTKTLTGESFKKINTKTSHGSITVSVVSTGEPRVEVFIRANNGNERLLSKAEIQERLDLNYTLTIAVTNGELVAIARPKNNIVIGKKTLGISFVIYVQGNNYSSSLSTSHGNVLVSGLTGNQDIETSHGNLELEKISGQLTGRTSHGNISINGSATEIDLQTSHGNIDAKNCEGTIKLITSKGDVRLSGLKGKVQVGTDHGNLTGDKVTGELSGSTSHGDITFRDLSCGVKCSTNHGNINLLFDELVGPITAGNSHGNISLELPKGKGIDVDLQAKTISIDALENYSGSKDAHSMKGSLHGGGIAVKAETGKGTVSLSFK